MTNLWRRKLRKFVLASLSLSLVKVRSEIRKERKRRKHLLENRRSENAPQDINSGYIPKLEILKLSSQGKLSARTGDL